MRFALASALLLAAQLAPSAAEEVISLLARNYYAYGYEGDVTDGVPNGYAYGMGGLETVAYDKKEKILYGISEQGFVTLIDQANGPEGAPQLPIVVRADDGTPTYAVVCPDRGLLLLVTKDDPNPGHVFVYKAAVRSEDGTVSAPEYLTKVEVGYGPDHARQNSACTMLAVANEGEGDYDDTLGLINPPGSVSLVNLEDLDNVSSTNVPFTWTDEELIAKDIHLPLSKNALEYWDLYSSVAEDLNFTLARATYTTDTVLEPEWVEWSADEKYVLANLQENAAVVKVNVATATAEDIYSYGLKSWEATPIDIIEDDGCATMPTVPGLFSVRTPDSIAVINVDGQTYVVTANEGDDVEYGDFEEKQKAKDIFVGSSLGLLGASADPAVFDPSSPLTSLSKYFNDECDEALVGWCATSMRMAVGSTMVDYSNATAPFIKKMVAIGGRGLSVYKLTDEGLDLVWDSMDEFETEGCKAFPWAHNGIQDEEFADVNGTLWFADPDLQETLLEMNDPEEDGCEDRGDGLPGACALGDTVDERSLKDGYAAEAVVSGEACGKRYMVTVSEKNSVGFLYDVSDIENPTLVQVFHLSPASETKNPVVAYADRTLGEIDAEAILFMEADESLNGKAGILFAGAWSSTTSFWEFNCGGDDIISTPEEAPAGGEDSTTMETPAGGEDSTTMETPAAGEDSTTMETPAAGEDSTTMETPAAGEDATTEETPAETAVEEPSSAASRAVFAAAVITFMAASLM